MERTIDVVAAELDNVQAQIKHLSTCKLALELELSDLVGHKHEGTVSSKTEAFRVSTVGKLNRSLMPGVTFADVAGAVGQEAAAQLLKQELKIVTSAYRSLTPLQHKALAHLIAAKPAKTAVKVERLGDE